MMTSTVSPVATASPEIVKDAFGWGIVYTAAAPHRVVTAQRAGDGCYHVEMLTFKLLENDRPKLMALRAKGRVHGTELETLAQGWCLQDEIPSHFSQCH